MTTTPDAPYSTRPSIFDVAQYLLGREHLISMKLQKLTYLVQGWALARSSEPMFDEPFQAWPSGPVCRDLFDAHEEKLTKDVVPERFRGRLRGLTAAQEAFIDSVHYAGHTGISLSWLTQNQRPWVKVRQLNQLGARELCTEIIQIEDIRRYFIDLDQTQRRSEQGRSLNPFNPVTM